MTWETVEHVTRPYIENPAMRIVNVSMSEDESGIVTFVIHFAPVNEDAQKEGQYAEGSI